MSDETNEMRAAVDLETETMTEYLVVANKTNKVIISTMDYKQAVKTASMIRQAGGDVTIFRSLKT